MTDLIESRPAVLPSEADSDLAREASRKLSKLPETELRVRIDSEELLLPRAATRLIQHLLTEMGRGNAVTLIPIHAELSTQEAADYLNVSRPYLIRLLESGRIPFHKVGTHRRVRFEELMRYKDILEKKRRAAMDELAAQAQKMGMGY